MIRDRGVAHRYAAALFGAAKQRGELETVRRDLSGLEAMHEKDASLQLFLEAPNVRDEEKRSLIERLLQALVSPVTLHFLLLLLRKKRIQHLPLVFDDFRRLYEEEHGLERAEVRTAVPFPADLEEQLTRRLEALSGRKISLVRRVDPSIIGGVVVLLRGKILDGSVRRRLDALRDELMAARVV